MATPGNSVLTSFGTTIFETMSRLAAAHGAVNLGQGFPEGLEPPPLLARLAEAAAAGPHQYPSMMGIPELRRAVAAHERRCWGLDLDPMAEVMVTSGATEALAACFLGLIEPGDEVVLIEPLYDSYLPIIRRAGGVPRLVRIAAARLVVAARRNWRRRSGRAPACWCSTARPTRPARSTRPMTWPF